MGRAARHEGRVDRGRERVPDVLGDEPHDLDHGARTSHRGGDRRRPQPPDDPQGGSRGQLENLSTKGDEMAVTAEIQVRDKLYIGGEWVDPTGTETIDVVNASTEEVMGRIPQGSPEDVNRAVAAARAAFETWSQTEMVERAELIRAVAAGLAARSEEIASTISQELGMPIVQSTAIQAGLPTMTFTS